MASTVSTISAKFSNDSTLKLSGKGKAKVKMRLTWDDNPDNAGDAIDDVICQGVNMDSPGEDGNSTDKTNNLHRGSYGITYTGQPYGKSKLSDTRIGFKDGDGSDWNAELFIDGVEQQTYTSREVEFKVNGSNTDINVEVGDSLSVAWSTVGCGNSSEGDYVKVTQDGTERSTATSGTFTDTAAEGSTTYKVKAYNFLEDADGDNGVTTKKIKVNAYKKPSGTISLSPSAVVQNNACSVGATSNGITVSWTSDGNDGGVEILGNWAGGSAATITASNKSSGSHVFYPTNSGTNFKLRLKVTNAVGTSVTTENQTYTVYDTCPDDFEWSDSTDNTPLNNENRESESITIDGFGPTPDSNNLKIKSNYPIQVSVNGGGWQNVEQI